MKGVILKEGSTFTLEGGILHMITHGTVSLVTNTSKHGIILKIESEDTPFETMDGVTSICLKLCFLDTGSRVIGGIEKYAVSREDFAHEVQLQQDIFETVPDVCPCIITAMIDEQPPRTLSLFQRLRLQSRDKTLLDELSIRDSTVKELIDTTLPIGIVAMEMIPQSEPFDQTHEMKDHISVVAKLIRIFYRKDERGVVGTIHCDCHLGNILKNEKDIVIIDFGTTVDRYTPFTEEEKALFLRTWEEGETGETLMQVYDKCCSFQLDDVKEVDELLNFFMFMDAIKNKKYDVLQMNSLLTPLLPDCSIDTPSRIKPFEPQDFRTESCLRILSEYKREVPDHSATIRQLQEEGRMFKRFRAGKRNVILAERRRRRRIIRPHPYEVIRTLQEGRLFDGNPTKKLRGPLQSLPEPDRSRDPVLEPMSAEEKHALFTQLTEMYGLTDEKAREIVEISNQDTRSIYDLVVQALQDPSNRGGNNKRIKHVSKRSTASYHHATRRYPSQRKKSGTLRRVQR